jgi:hypothetical protein
LFDGLTFLVDECANRNPSQQGLLSLHTSRKCASQRAKTSGLFENRDTIQKKWQPFLLWIGSVNGWFSWCVEAVRMVKYVIFVIISGIWKIEHPNCTHDDGTNAPYHGLVPYCQGNEAKDEQEASDVNCVSHFFVGCLVL